MNPKGTATSYETVDLLIEDSVAQITLNRPERLNAWNAQLGDELRDAILAKGREAGWLRVQGGVHFPTDVYAGRVLGQELARDFLRSPQFLSDLAAVKAELAAAAK